MTKLIEISGSVNISLKDLINASVRLNNIHSSMKSRCYSVNTHNYRHYGARGIKICDGWMKSFDNFALWSLKNGYGPKLSLDRIDNNGNYEPSNCRWVTHKAQCSNRRSNRFLVLNGERLTISQWAKKLNISRGTIKGRLNSGWSVKKALSEPKSNHRAIKFRGKSMTIGEWAKEIGMSSSTLDGRISSGWPIERAMTEPVPVRNSNRIEFNGRLLTKTEWAKEIGVSPSTISKRLKEYGWSVEKTFTTPGLKKKNA